jgi:8-oxo-dGTP pyrophosphatase MutT (NUDIX family)
MEKSAGIAIIYEGKILMAHATNSPWYRSWMPPKGKIEEGETEEEAACREVEEECGISVDPSMLGQRHVIPYVKGKGGKKYKEVYIFECRIDSLKDLEIPNLVRGEIPTYMLQEEEVSNARFMGYEECKERSLPRYLPMVEEIFSKI